ncbi:MAG: hypothetical protein A2849_01850 [Candidatus Taylorbacteria bacterium RIFCSPHIGHO2_01_FULL_51_15]|uniref:UDP-N-acetylglucosamine--N-acetylmuramyl-(pentapeptide) pyrophosphoryl-undecaprenol N-acetylglucosamine transferase n=1 Tax=Candidatus Taylorbacteria bacterium RIFCSPHIGHO2_01_FULL_51_15 TaxID=1802304 RepID=A0A1G2M9R2_9BACT|nr:MAG: hypothetical protein A2849_01850 [Candidatus Taylorbacteria bacterium RIFCSPHIGHO2_01_FULL_51_15]
MKILFTGGGSGGHFYPIIAIAEKVRALSKGERLIAPELFFMAPEPYDEGLLYENGVAFIRIPTGKLRGYSSLSNVTDIFKTAFGMLKALVILFRVYPDIVVGKGGFGSFPALFAARLLGIPIFIHESDTVPGRVSKWAGKFALRVAVSFEETASFFPAGRVAHTGNPMREAILTGGGASADADLQLRGEGKLITVLGGSLGSTRINEAILQSLPELLKKYEVVHQTGRKNLADMTARAKVLLQNHGGKLRYHPFGYLSAGEVRRAGELAHLIVSRAGSTLFEIAAWGKPSILIPISDSHGDHQRENAYTYGRSGAAEVLEEENLTPTIFRNQVESILENEERAKHMSEAASRFAKTDAAEVIAREILEIALKHEK